MISTKTITLIIVKIFHTKDTPERLSIMCVTGSPSIPSRTADKMEAGYIWYSFSVVGNRTSAEPVGRKVTLIGFR